MNLVLKIKEKVQNLLKNRFHETLKHEIKDNGETLRIACPYCGDSKEKLHAKRGNLYIQTGFYHCFNCSKHVPIAFLLKHFKQDIESVYLSELRQRVSNANRKIIKEFNSEIINFEKLAIPKHYLFKKLKLNEISDKHPYVSERLLKHRLEHLAINGDDLYILNVIDNKYVIGFQVKKNFIDKKNSFYKKYTLKEIYESFVYEVKVNADALENFNKISLLYGFFDVDFTKKVTIFEGAINSWFLNNSIATSSANISFDFLDECSNVRYFQDNDEAGQRLATKKIKKGIEVFLWKKFIREFKLPPKINDLNDVVKYCFKFKKIEPIKNIENYFSNNKFDHISI